MTSFFKSEQIYREKKLLMKEINNKKTILDFKKKTSNKMAELSICSFSPEGNHFCVNFYVHGISAKLSV